MSIRIRNTVIGESIPKICVPIVASNFDDIIKSAKQIKTQPFDIVEWRADFFDKVLDYDSVSTTIKSLRDILADAPLLFTFRSSNEGGNREINSNSYTSLLKYVCQNDLVDLIDVEIFFKDINLKEIIDIAHKHNIYVIGSNHDFDATPAKDIIVSRLEKMLDLGVDIPKIALMPNSKSDVLTLLAATSEFTEIHFNQPIVTMSMATDGLVSRLFGEVFGSAITFGAVGQISAPGQINTKDLAAVLDIIHKNIQ